MYTVFVQSLPTTLNFRGILSSFHQCSMATSCLRQVAASSLGIRSLILPSSGTPVGQVRITNGFLGASIKLKAKCQNSPIRRSRAVVVCETAASPVSETEVEPEVVAAIEEETVFVEVEEVEQGEVDQSKTGKARKTKGLKNIMQTLHQQAVAAASEGKDIPNLRTGDIVQLRLEVPENKKRVSLLRGIVIAVHSAGIHTTFRIRRVIAGVGVELVIPLYSPNIKDIKVVNSRKVRRAKLYYLRDKLARLSTV